MLQSVAKTDPRPTRSATVTPMDSPKTTSTSAPSSRTTTASDMKIESPYTFQKGLSSSTSYMTFIASITERNAPEREQDRDDRPESKCALGLTLGDTEELALYKLRGRLRRYTGELVDHGVDEVGRVEEPKKRKQEGEKREDREEAFVGEVPSKCH